MHELRTILAFTRAVFRHWTALLTGGIIALALEIWNQFRGGTSPPIFLLILGTAILIACYLVWKEQHRAREILFAERASHDNIKIALDESDVDFDIEFRTDGLVSYELKSFKISIFNLSVIHSIHDLTIELKLLSDDFKSLLYYPESSLLPSANSDTLSIKRIERLDLQIEMKIDLVDTLFGRSTGVGNQFDALRMEQDLKIEVSAKDTKKKTLLVRYYPNSIPHFKVPH